MASNEFTRKIVFGGIVMNVVVVGYISLRRQWALSQKLDEDVEARQMVKSALENPDLQCFFGNRAYMIEGCWDIFKRDNLAEETEEEKSCRNIEEIMKNCQQKIYDQIPAQTPCQEPLPIQFQRDLR